MTRHVDVAVIGSGPAGVSAASTAAGIGKRTVLIEREKALGGACVHHGTIPSKTLRETALELRRARTHFERRGLSLEPSYALDYMRERLGRVVEANANDIRAQLAARGVERLHGHARFVSPHALEITHQCGETELVRADVIVLAVGSRPRLPQELAIDHEHVLDSDSILSLAYLPSSLAVLGGGVIGAEYATIFAALGVRVTLLSRDKRPLPFVEEEITTRLVRRFEAMGGRYRGNARCQRVDIDEIDGPTVILEGGDTLRTDKVLVAAGRVSNVDKLHLDAAGLGGESTTLVVDANCRSRVPHIYGAGDVIGAPGLASTSMEQGRRAVCHAFGLPVTAANDTIPIGIYTIPEIARVGCDEATARRRDATTLVGRATFQRMARGHILGAEGLLKLMVSRATRQILGVSVFGDGAIELVHVGQVAMAGGMAVDRLVESTFNFPTLAEAYRTAALDVLEQMTQRPRSQAA
ncbi:MAG: Si-specific NAD(P)(+) transhydrogenase [Myxococcales bacterium FL481]|nr:MAG: Si-specific NAD(P)(+) transhydrogenase [Myxococcales bacterium FL481]